LRKVYPFGESRQSLLSHMQDQESDVASNVTSYESLSDDEEDNERRSLSPLSRARMLKRRAPSPPLLRPPPGFRDNESDDDDGPSKRKYKRPAPPPYPPPPLPSTYRYDYGYDTDEEDDGYVKLHPLKTCNSCGLKELPNKWAYL